MLLHFNLYDCSFYRIFLLYFAPILLKLYRLPLSELHYFAPLLLKVEKDLKIYHEKYYYEYKYR